MTFTSATISGKPCVLLLSSRFRNGRTFTTWSKVKHVYWRDECRVNNNIKGWYHDCETDDAVVRYNTTGKEWVLDMIGYCQQTSSCSIRHCPFCGEKLPS